MEEIEVQKGEVRCLRIQSCLNVEGDFNRDCFDLSFGYFEIFDFDQKFIFCFQVYFQGVFCFFLVSGFGSFIIVYYGDIFSFIVYYFVVRFVVIQDGSEGFFVRVVYYGGQICIGRYWDRGYVGGLGVQFLDFSLVIFEFFWKDFELFL